MRLAALALGLSVACAAPLKAVGPPKVARIAVLPPVSLGGTSAPLKELRLGVEAALRARGVELVEPALLEEFLTRQRVRYTGGVDRAVALAAERELGAQALLVTSLELFRPEGPPKLAVLQRLVATGERPAILWIDAASRAGDDAPGAFDLGLIPDYPTLQARVLERLAASLAAWRSGTGPHAGACEPAWRFQPRNVFRSHLAEPGAERTVAVLPFLNETRRRNAGELLALEFVRQLEAAGNFHVVEPGLVRDEFLRYRIMMEEGVSLDTARISAELLHVDLVLAGYLRDFDEGTVPKVEFTTLLLDHRDSEVLWQSSSGNKGDDGVYFFDAGMEATATGLACRMVRAVVDGLNKLPPTPPPAPRKGSEPVPRKGVRPL